MPIHGYYLPGQFLAQNTDIDNSSKELADQFWVIIVQLVAFFNLFGKNHFSMVAN